MLTLVKKPPLPTVTGYVLDVDYSHGEIYFTMSKQAMEEYRALSEEDKAQFFAGHFEHDVALWCEEGGMLCWDSVAYQPVVFQEIEPTYFNNDIIYRITR